MIIPFLFIAQSFAIPVPDVNDRPQNIITPAVTPIINVKSASPRRFWRWSYSRCEVSIIIPNNYTIPPGFELAQVSIRRNNSAFISPEVVNAGQHDFELRYTNSDNRYVEVNIGRIRCR